MRRDTIQHPAAPTLTDYCGLYSQAPEMEELFRLIGRVARTDCTVLVRGETGSGKELVARAIHDLSPRAKYPFQAINCATFSPTLLESEMFGHMRGAFTGAVSDHQGVLQQADKGTLFLDEVAEMPLDIQARLLRVLEDKTYVPVGGTKAKKADIRFISASNKALRREVAAGRFRNDLRYRLRVVPIFIPPLRQRAGDVEALLWLFIDQFNEQGLRYVEEVSRGAMQALLAYPWPGNVRELRNVVEHAFIVGEGPLLNIQDLTPELRGELPPGSDGVNGLDGGLAEKPLQQLERNQILAALAKHNGKKAQAAEELGMSRSTLWRKLRELQLQ
jgi:DNA-binding NtrC family response regulator